VKLRNLLLIAGLLSAGSSAALAMGSASIAPVTYYPGYTPTVLNYAASQGGMLTVVMGNPFEQADASSVESEITAVMARSHFGPRLPFITTAPEGFASPYRVVVLLDSARHITPYKVCGDYSGEPEATGRATIHVQTVLCANDKPLSSATARVSGVTSPSDPKFRQLIGQMSILLFPPRSESGPRRNGDLFL